jgi:hypothetical protein
MEEDALHVLIVVVVVTVRMPVVSVVMVVRMPVAMMGMPKSGETDDVDQEAKDADDEKFIEPM